MKEATINLLKEIESNGYKAYSVGGYPRDLYLNRKCMDVDICTNATPQDLKKIFNIKLDSNEKYGEVSLQYKGYRFEITTFRKELKYEKNRIPVKIQYIDNLIDDLKRRDFIINTLCLTSNDEIIDLMGAKKDMDNKIINCVTDADNQIKEDSLRILRAIRFATLLNFNLSASLKDAIKKNKNNLKKLSFFRKKEELNKIFQSKNILYGINLIRELDISDELGLEKINDLVVTSSVIGIWAQLNVLDKYPFTVEEKTSIKKINQLINLNIYNKYIIYNYDLYELCLTAEIKKLDKKKIVNMQRNLKIHSRKDIDITIDEICCVLNIEKDYRLKFILEDLEKKIVLEELPNVKSDIVNYLKNN